VDALTRLLQEAAAMSTDDYRRLAQAAHASLDAALVRPEFYGEAYRAMLLRPRRRAVQR
jgi:hypothetical protein